jgi:3-methylcrotonyl-CoA carboxylase beta subunit
VLFNDSSLKAAHFMQLCDRDRTPLVFLQNITGYMSGASTKSAASPRTAPR